MKTSSSINIHPKAFTRRETLEFLVMGIMGVATTGSVSEAGNNRQWPQHQDNVPVT